MKLGLVSEAHSEAKELVFLSRKAFVKNFSLWLVESSLNV